MKKPARSTALVMTGISIIGLTTSCQTKKSVTPKNVTTAVHSKGGGWIALKWMESPAKAAKGDQKMEGPHFIRLLGHDKKDDPESLEKRKRQIREGDLIAFRMKPTESTRSILSGNIQKIPYSLFRYGHLVIIVRDPEDPESGRLKLLSIYMGSHAETNDGLEYLDDKNWDLFRIDDEHAHQLDKKRLREFVTVALERACKKTSYDMPGAFGLWTNDFKPESREEIPDVYTCTTLVSAALHYSGVKLHDTRRRGYLDILTPFQVVASAGRN